jgi:hypothetical protein
VALSDLIDAVEAHLECDGRDARQQEVLAWLDLLTDTRAEPEGEPFLKLRGHFFQRMQHGLWCCVDQACSAKPDSLNDWPFGNVYLTQRSRCACSAPVYELGFCDQCKAPHLEGDDEGGFLRQPPPFRGDEFSLLAGC